MHEPTKTAMPGIATAGAILVEKLVESLEQMAFVCVMPAEGPLPAPQRPLLVWMDFAGPAAGRIQLLASEALGAALAANILGAPADSPEAAFHAQDALRELLNVTCGGVLSGWPDLDPGACQMTIPQAKALAPEEWETLAGDGFALLDAEGNPLGIRMIERPS